MGLRDFDYFRGLFDVNPMKVLASCVRGMIKASEGKVLVCADFSAIEARIVAWLAGQQDILDVFDAGEPVYKYTASKIYKIPIEDVTAEQRFIGKTAVLALGYQGGHKAFAKMAYNHGVEIEPVFADQIKTDWRAANPKIVSFGIEWKK